MFVETFLMMMMVWMSLRRSMQERLTLDVVVMRMLVCRADLIHICRRAGGGGVGAVHDGFGHRDMFFQTRIHSIRVCRGPRRKRSLARRQVPRHHAAYRSNVVLVTESTGRASIPALQPSQATESSDRLGAGIAVRLPACQLLFTPFRRRARAAVAADRVSTGPEKHTDSSNLKGRRCRHSERQPARLL